MIAALADVLDVGRKTVTTATKPGGFSRLKMLMTLSRKSKGFFNMNEETKIKLSMLLSNKIQGSGVCAVTTKDFSIRDFYEFSGFKLPEWCAALGIAQSTWYAYLARQNPTTEDLFERCATLSLNARAALMGVDWLNIARKYAEVEKIVKDEENLQNLRT